MLLACCFRDPSKKKHKKNKNWKNENVRDNEESYAPSKRLLSSPKISSIHHVEPYSSAINTNISTCQKPLDNNITQNKHFLPEKLLKLEKELKIHRRSCAIDFISDTSTPYKKDSNNQIISPTSTNISTIQCLEGNRLIQRDVSRMFASAEDLEGSLLSVSSAHQSLQISNESLVSSSTTSLTNISLTSLLPTKQDSSKDETITLTNFSSSDKELSNSIEKQYKQKPIEIEVIKENVNKTEEVIKKVRIESENSIQSVKIQNQIELEKLKESYAAKLLEEKENHMKNVEKENSDAKNEANETIAQLNKQIIHERGKTFAKQQQNSKHLEEEFGIKNEQLSQSLKQIEQREMSWQEERADVLNEVQRLKAEAIRMVKILAMDYEGEPCGEYKRRSLSQEVYSLQLVVEMRSGEVRKIRDQLARATQQLEQAEIDKEKLKKATARMEDLEEQLNIKKKKERQLIDEKIQLEMSLENTSNNADRISQNMEALQWRIRNNFDLPVDNLQPVTCEQPYLDHPSVLADEHSPYTDDDQSKSSFSCDGVPAKVDADMHDDQIKNDIATSLSCSHEFGSTRVLHGMNLNSSETEQKLSDAESTNSDDCQVNNWNDDGESLDEGVGDISSECEHGANDHFGDQNYDNSNKSDKSDGQLSESDLEASMDKCNSFDSPERERERIASIF